MKNLEVCSCDAYEFQHELNSGKCKNTSIEAPICGYCKCHCNPKWVDFGIGHFEFWGSKEVDYRPEFVSDCCESPVYTDQECKLEVDPEDLELEDRYG